MSTFLIIKTTKSNTKKNKDRAQFFYEKTNILENKVSPRIFSANWGSLIYWEGINERLATWRSDNIADARLDLGWNAHTELEPNLETKLLTATCPINDLSPLILPQHSVGIYNLIKATPDSVACIPDPFSSYPIYYSVKDNEAFISNDPILTMAMAGHTPVPSKLGIIERLLTEGNLVENYIFENIPRLRPGQWISVTENNFLLNSYRFEIKKVEQVTLEKYMLDQFKKLAHCGRPVVLKLTGGRDTRLNLALALRAGLRPLCYTINSVDSTVADELSKCYGLLHVHVDLNGHPIDKSTPAAQEYDKIISRAVYISGANGSISRAHYLKEETGDITDEKKTVIKTYLGYKRNALLTAQNFNVYLDFFLRWWEAMKIEKNNWWCKGHQFDAIYIERCRTFGGEAWARPSGAIDVPTLSGPLMYAYGLCFSPKQRTQDITHETIIKSCIGEQKIKYLGHSQNIVNRLLNSLPLVLKVIITRFLYKYRYKKLPNEKKLSEDTFAQFKDLLSRGEMEVLYLNRKFYVDEVSNIIKRSRLIVPR
jgi:hypothetical protein